LLNELDADRKLKNPSRVLRVAGAWHLKVEAEPVQCQLSNITEKKYSQAEIETALAKYSQTKITTPKPIKSVQSASSDIPLSRCLPNRQRELIAKGITSGSRNNQGYGLAKDLIATAQYLIQSGISFSEDAKSLFLDYCHRCDQTDWGDLEWESIWSSAGKSAGDPPLTPEMIGNCLKKWERENQVKVKPSQDKEPANDEAALVEVKTSTPLQPVASYIDDSNPDQSSQTNQEAIILPPSYSYQERAVMAIYGKGKYLSHGGELFKYNGKFYEKLESEVEALKIRD
jgi:hypothetical protein